ncbi:hypothetical protein [Mesorhizobium sp.]|uniref:hypothetical protein n=1 Tax=Mesorhizobium sp. TaxID=1871066 RepID=UPI0025F2541E|nr:hypothetical protein [Mesorhizobium sp.]
MFTANFDIAAPPGGGQRDSLAERFDHIDARACFASKRPDCGGTDKGAGIGFDGQDIILANSYATVCCLVKFSHENSNRANFVRANSQFAKPGTE